jgi:hypothetical protein
MLEEEEGRIQLGAVSAWKKNRNEIRLILPLMNQCPLQVHVGTEHHPSIRRSHCARYVLDEGVNVPLRHPEGNDRRNRLHDWPRLLGMAMCTIGAGPDEANE